MANPDLTRFDERMNLIKEIESEENISRKREAQRRFDVYRDRQDRYIVEQLQNEFSVKTVKEMRKITSINMSKKIVEELSSIYKNPPERSFSNASENESTQLENLYHHSKANSRYKTSNRYYNLFDQNDLMVLPRKGIVELRPLTLMSYDVVPDANDPESAYAYILNAWDVGSRGSYLRGQEISRERSDYYGRDFMNQKIADSDDRKALMNRYVVWTPEMHFTMNGRGEIVGDVIENPIMRLPFINAAMEKDSQFYVERGAGITNFSVEFAVCLSDLANTVKFQSHSQAVITAAKAPKNMVVGPNHILFLQLDPKNPELSPKFEFVSPSPDIGNALNFLDLLMKLFLSSMGIDSKSMAGLMTTQGFASGVERFLSMVERFEASKDDLDVYEQVEFAAFDLMRDWSNLMQGVNDETRLRDDLNLATISDQVELQLKFKGPEVIKTESEELDVVERRLDLGLISKKRALMRIDGVDEDMATEILQMIDEEDLLKPPPVERNFLNGGADDQEIED